MWFTLSFGLSQDSPHTHQFKISVWAFYMWGEFNVPDELTAKQDSTLVWLEIPHSFHWASESLECVSRQGPPRWRRTNFLLFCRRNWGSQGHWRGPGHKLNQNQVHLSTGPLSTARWACICHEPVLDPQRAGSWFYSLEPYWYSARVGSRKDFLGDTTQTWALWVVVVESRVGAGFSSRVMALVPCGKPGIWGEPEL